MAWQFFVVDGADAEQIFPLPEDGTVRIGRNPGDADIGLNDLYVAPLHCAVITAGDMVVVRPLQTNRSILVNGVPSPGCELQEGDVLRVGNSHLRLEPFDPERAPPPEPPKPAGPPPLPELPLERLDELGGRKLAHYELGEVLGRGHFGVVFAARDLKSGQGVALKVLSPEFPQDAGEMKTFTAAMRAVLGLRHPHLVTLLNAGKTGPYCWLAQEQVEGVSLAEQLAQLDSGKSRWRAALRIGVHLGRALQFLHPKGVLHGNITPANVLIRTDDKVVKLNSLMLSRALEGSALQGARLEKKLLAELGYLAPEQVLPDALVDHLADLYGVGAVMYARLTGRPPFLAATPEETLRLITEAAPVRPRALHKSTPDPLDSMIMRMLARRQEERYETAAQMVAELEDLADEEDVEV
jgi:serine/threonine protein kinase